jgi:hypothetical protein
MKASMKAGMGSRQGMPGSSPRGFSDGDAHGAGKEFDQAGGYEPYPEGQLPAHQMDSGYAGRSSYWAANSQAAAY